LPDLSWSKIPKRGKIYQITTKYTKWPQNITNGSKMDQMVIKYTKIFRSKTLQNLPKLGFLVGKQTIWQPWAEVGAQLCFQNYPVAASWVKRGANPTIASYNASVVKSYNATNSIVRF
jgi:hypothetical protein